MICVSFYITGLDKVVIACDERIAAKVGFATVTVCVCVCVCVQVCVCVCVCRCVCVCVLWVACVLSVAVRFHVAGCRIGPEATDSKQLCLNK